MDIGEKAKLKGKELRKSGWPIKGIWVCKTPATKAPRKYIFVLKMDRVAQEQMKKIYCQVRKTDPWLVLYDFGEGYVGFYTPTAMVDLQRHLVSHPPLMLWEASSERKTRNTRLIASSRRSGT